MTTPLLQSQDMVEITRSSKKEEEEPVCTSEEGFALLAAEVEVLALEDVEDGEEEEDFEVIPVSDCFNLDVPFVLDQHCWWRRRRTTTPRRGRRRTRRRWRRMTPRR